MTLRDRISLTWRYGKGIFLIGAVYNLVCAGFQVDSFILKVALLAITMFRFGTVVPSNFPLFYLELLGE